MSQPLIVSDLLYMEHCLPRADYTPSILRSVSPSGLLSITDLLYMEHCLPRADYTPSILRSVSQWITLSLSITYCKRNTDSYGLITPRLYCTLCLLVDYSLSLTYFTWNTASHGLITPRLYLTLGLLSITDLLYMEHCLPRADYTPTILHSVSQWITLSLSMTYCTRNTDSYGLITPRLYLTLSPSGLLSITDLLYMEHCLPRADYTPSILRSVSQWITLSLSMTYCKRNTDSYGLITPRLYCTLCLLVDYSLSLTYCTRNTASHGLITPRLYCTLCLPVDYSLIVNNLL
ncbi:hypothetical protein J6590_018871 [Homalodisca vitripennis]|nr:hypothetical protein J6590_018871 [Homalodisca vitripennis]